MLRYRNIAYVSLIAPFRNSLIFGVGFDRSQSGCRNLAIPVGRAVEPPSFGEVIQIPQVGGLHHLYTRKAA